MEELGTLEAAALSRTTAIANVLKQAIGVAEELDDREALRWLREELDGYAFADRVPDYRRLKSTIVVRFADNRLQPVTWTSPKRGRGLSICVVRDGAPTIEKLVRESTPGLFHGIDRNDVLPYIRDEVPADARVGFSVTLSQGRALLEKIRRRIFEWAASIETPDATPANVPAPQSPKRVPATRPEVFIVHGHNYAVRDQIDLFLTKDLNLRTIVMQAGTMGGMTIPEKFEDVAARASFAVFIVTGDDVLTINGAQIRRARQNVILEIGYFWGRLGRRGNVAFLVEPHPDMELPSDIQGVGWIPITADLAETKLRLRNELVMAGILSA